MSDTTRPPIEAPSEPEDPGEVRSALVAFEESERLRLGLPEPAAQWHDHRPRDFTTEQRASTTILFGGATATHDKLVEAALTSLGYKAEALTCPDGESLQVGKEYGNRAQCNPTYFTVGNLLKHLFHLRDEVGLSVEEIIDRYIFVTAGSCGPCRFGMYITEYRKSLREAGFDGFRVLLLDNGGSISQSAADAGLALTPRFFITVIKGFMAGDVLNAMGYRVRPYELVAGSTDRALEECRDIVADALGRGGSVLAALYRCRRVFNRVEVDRLQPKPKVSIIGEFWAMTTEGEGNYRLQRFLESEGAECEVQMITSWLLYTVWEVENVTRKRLRSRRSKPNHPMKIIALARLGQVALEQSFHAFARALGLRHYHLPKMGDLARLSDGYYLTEIRGGEGHMEVGKVIDTAQHDKAHLVISVKPFGCLPSSGVSDGVQSLVTARHPNANFLPVETSGDGAVNVHSRVQMALFRARQKAKEEFEEALSTVGATRETAARKLKGKPRLGSAVHYPPHRVATTAANALLELR